MVDEADLVLTAEAAHRTFILDDHPGSFRKVFTLGQFAEAVRVADPSLTGRDLLEVVGERRGAADASLDVDDPYSPRPGGRRDQCRTHRGPRASRPKCTTRREVGSLPMNDLITTTFFSIMAAGFIVGIVVGLTGMGGGALMTPALIFLGVGDAATVVTADLTAAAIYKTGGAITHSREGSPNFSLAKWLILGSVPMALLGPWLIRAVAGSEPESLDTLLKECIGFALLLAAATYALRLYVNLRRVRGGVGDAARRPATSARWPRCWSAPSAACWSASPASAPARSS